MTITQKGKRTGNFQEKKEWKREPMCVVEASTRWGARSQQVGRESVGQSAATIEGLL